jgi:hypothetical protein
MSLALLPENARKSDLIQVLVKKLEAPQPVAFDYIGQLVQLANQVTPDVAQINRLFPEYTPHDAQYHLNRLFDVADRVIEKRRYESLNAVELFVIAASLYAHDWGMAVSDAERDALKEALTAKKRPTGFDFLHKEHELVEQFAGRSNVPVAVVFDDVSLWREYVRETHAERSAQRARSFFMKEGGGVGDAIGRVAWAHGIEFEELQRPEAFPIDFGVNGCSVNLRALAVYIRLIDLLDIADDRTPYAIWHFVAPRNPRSAMEWKKHRALHPVTFPSYQSSRRILVDGSTNDPEVWAALRDLARYVDDQVRGCNDLLSCLADARYHLDLPVVEWRIHAEGFSPVDLRFEFNRERTFHILSEEIYDGDCYVFLRELLQNSIDAIRMRKELLQRDGMQIDGLIRFEVQHSSNGDTVVRCYDNGIGMDEYIIRNYLAVAGRSFYTSADFKRHGLQMDAISRFGIGILSCFMAADEIAIETLRDPNIAGRKEPLRIEIPHVTRQFRVFPGDGTAKTGTCVTVKVLGKYLSTAPEGWNHKLRVTDYIAQVAGFVEFPILIQEDLSSVVIVHPDADQAAVRQSVSQALGRGNPTRIEIRCKGLIYPWDKMFAPQDIPVAQEHLEIEWFNIDDLWEESEEHPFEGRIGVVVPKQKQHLCFASHNFEDPHYRALSVITPGESKLTPVSIRCCERFKTNGEPISISQDPTTDLHYNGIMVPQNFEGWRSSSAFSIPDPYYAVNVRRSSNTILNVARSAVRGEHSSWRDQINAHLHSAVLRKHAADIMRMSPEQRFMAMGRLRAWYHISTEQFESEIPIAVWAVPWFHSDRSWSFTEIQDVVSEKVPVFPDFRFTNEVEDSLRVGLGYPITTRIAYSVIDYWAGEPSVCVRDLRTEFYFRDEIQAALYLTDFALSRVRPNRKIRFIKGWRFDADCIPQTCYFKTQEAFERDPAKLQKMAFETNEVLLPQQWEVLRDYHRSTTVFGEEVVGVFESPFERCFGFGACAFNLAHPSVQLCLWLDLALSLHPHSKQLKPAVAGTLRDLLNHAWNSFLSYTSYTNGQVRHNYDIMVEAFQKADLFPNVAIPPAPRVEDLVPDSIVEVDGVPMLVTGLRYGGSNPSRSFGQCLGS